MWRSTGTLMTDRQLPRPGDFVDLLKFQRPTLDRRAARLARAHTIADLRKLAKRNTPKAPFDYADGAPDAPPQPVVRPTHVGTSLLGLVPLPRGLVTVALQMAMHDDGRGWDLVADVSALFGALCLIRYEGPLRRVEPENENLVAGFHHLVLYDGECNLCNWSVDFVMRNDAAEVFVFAPQQSLAAVEALHRAGHQPPPSTAAGREPPPRGGGDASVLLLAADGQLHQRSAAALRVGLALDWPWPVLAALAMLVPAPVRNAVYDWVGRNRYRWFGRAPSCRVPTAAERRRFLLDK